MDCSDAKPSKNQVAQSPNERGSVIIWILLAVAFFGALSFMMSKGMRSGASTIDKERASLIASEILNYNRALKNAVHELQINDCADTEISFERGGSYVNPNAPSDKSCHVFEPEGAGLRLTKIPEDIKTINTAHRYPIFVGQTAVLNIGTASSELYLWTRTRSKEVCMEYNDLVDISNIANDAPVEGGFNITPLFVGAYSAGTIFGDDNDGANFNGKMTGCHKDFSETDTDGVPFYDFYQVLIAR